MNPNPLRILVVDDEDAIVELVSEYLRTRGFEVDTAGDGDVALAKLHSRPFDVILVDLRLPSRGGMALLEAMVEMPTPVAVVVMTGYGTVETATQAMKLGASDYLLKPVRLREVNDALLLAVEAMRERRRAQERKHRTRLYEALLDLGPALPRDALLAELGHVLRSALDAQDLQIFVDEGQGWQELERQRRGPGAPGEELVLEMGEGLRLRIVAAGATPDPDRLGQARALMGATLSFLHQASPPAPRA